MQYKGIYWCLSYPFVRSFLRKYFSRRETKRILKNAKADYRRLLNEADDIGSDNPMASNLYFAILFISFLTANRALVDEGMLKGIIESVVCHPVVQFLMRQANLNNPKIMAKMNKSIRKSARWAEEHREVYPENWEFNFYEEPKIGCAYYFTTCPIAHFFQKQGLGDYTPIFCAIDYMTVAASNGKLIRKHTIADGSDLCDFWIVGDQTELP